METKLHPQMIEIIEKLFPERNVKESFDDISKSGKQYIEDIEYLTNKKDSDTVSESSTQLNITLSKEVDLNL